MAARYATDMAVRAGADGLSRDAVQEALVGLRRLMWQLRPRGGDGLADALVRLSLQLTERGLPALRLHIDPSADVLSPDTRVAAYRLVQAVVADGSPVAREPVTVRLVRQAAPGSREVLALSVDGCPPLRDPARWRRTVAALGGDLLSCPGRLRLALPVPPGAVAADANALSLVAAGPPSRAVAPVRPAAPGLPAAPGPSAATPVRLLAPTPKAFS